MSTGWKILIIVLAVLVVYLAARDWQRARWIRQELYVDWIEYNNFKYELAGPSDPSKPPPPPPDFGF